MNISVRFPALAIAAALLSVAVPARGAAQVAELPAYAYDMVAEVSMATTADLKCRGMGARTKKLEERIVALYRRLAADGISVQDAVAHLQGVEARAQIATREAALRARHGVEAQGDAALCAAIRAEAEENEALAELLRIR